MTAGKSSNTKFAHFPLLQLTAFSFLTSLSWVALTAFLVAEYLKHQSPIERLRYREVQEELGEQVIVVEDDVESSGIEQKELRELVIEVEDDVESSGITIERL